MITDDGGQYEDKWGWHFNHLWHASALFTGNEIMALWDLTGWYQTLFSAYTTHSSNGGCGSSQGKDRLLHFISVTHQMDDWTWDRLLLSQLSSLMKQVFMWTQKDHSLWNSCNSWAHLIWHFPPTTNTKKQTKMYHIYLPSCRGWVHWVLGQP